MASAYITLEDEADKRSDHSLLQSYIDCADTLIQKCEKLQHITGVQKLQRKCQAELKYLKSLSRRRGGFDRSHLRSSNLSHYLGVLHTADSLPGVVQVLQAFQCPGRSEALHVDVVAGQGHIWVKVVARKAQALHLVWAGRGQYGEKDLLLQAKDYIVCAKEHPVNFNDPQLTFVFYNGVTLPMAKHLESIGISVDGETVEVCEDVKGKLKGIEEQLDAVDLDTLATDLDSVATDIGAMATNFDAVETLSSQKSHCLVHVDESKFKDISGRVSDTICDQTNADQTGIVLEKENGCDKPNELRFLAETCSPLYRFIFGELLIEPLPSFDTVIRAFHAHPRSSVDAIKRVNLDVTALITLVSNVSNGSYNFRFNEKVLSLQAEEERTSPVKPVLSAFLKDKELYACESAMDSFKSILELLGGASEKQRAAELLGQVTVTPDCPSFRTSTLLNTGKIKDRSKIIFGSGDSLKAVTVTANSGFVRAAEHQGVTYAVFIHASRALTEQKEPLAEHIPS